MFATLSCIAIATATASSAPLAQLNSTSPQIHRGMAAAWSATVNFSGSQQTLSLKPPGRVSSPIGAWAPEPQIPIADFTFTNLVPNHPFANQPAGQQVRMDATSFGRSRIPRHPGNGAPSLSGVSTNWMTVAVSVSNSANGLPGGHIANVKANGNSPGAEIIAHYMDPNAALDQNLNDQTLVETRRRDLGFPQNGSADITSLDYPLGARTFAESTSASIFFSGDDSAIYFSVSRSWVMAGVTSNFAYDKNGQWVDANAGDIYKMAYAGGSWGVPTVHVSRAELIAGTGVSIDLVDVDGLDLDADGEVIIFSATKESNFSNQLMILQRAGGNSPTTTPGTSAGYNSTPLVTEGGVTVTSKLDVSDTGDELDAVCTFDPEKDTFDDQVATAANPLGWIANASLASLWTSGTRAGLSAARRQDVRPGTGLPDDMHLVLTGYGQASPQDAEWIIFFVGTDLSFSPLTNLMPRSDLGGTDTGELIIPIPASSGSLDVQVFGVIAAWDSNGQMLPHYPRGTWAATSKL